MKNGINTNYFKEIDCEEKAYFIGFIAADGYIDKNKSKLIFGQQLKDKEILEKLCELTGCTNKIAERHIWDKRTKKYYYQASLQICSKKFVSSLSKYRLDNNKTKNYIIQNIPDQYIKDCIRGLIDGDGYICNDRVTIITTMENIIFINKWLKSYYIKPCNCITEIKKENNVYTMYIIKDRFKFLDLIYKNNKICLSRKYKSYLTSKEIYKNRIKTITSREIIAYKDNIFINKYDSIVECSKSLNIPKSSISNQAAGRRKFAHGYTFKFGKILKKKVLVENNADLL